MKAVAAICVTALAFASANAASIVNGSFEDNGVDPLTARFFPIAPGSGELPGWTVVGDGIDLLTSRVLPAADGQFSLDLSAEGPGGIEQMITDLVPGRPYEVSFALEGDGSLFSPVKEVLVEVASFSETFAYETTTPRSEGTAMWQTVSFVFSAASSSETLRFTSLENNAFGPFLDDVTISEVPLPPAALLMLGGLALAAAKRRSA